MLAQSRQIASAGGYSVTLDGYYWVRGVNLDMLSRGESTEEILMVYTKIPKIAIFGVVEREKIGFWRGTLVEPRMGDTWTSRDPIVPDPILQYMSYQSHKMLASLDTVPEEVKRKTRQKMESLIQKEGDEYLERDAVQSLVTDDLMELPGESIVSDAIGWLAKSLDPRAQKMGSYSAT